MARELPGLAIVFDGCGPAETEFVDAAQVVAGAGEVAALLGVGLLRNVELGSPGLCGFIELAGGEEFLDIGGSDGRGALVDFLDNLGDFANNLFDSGSSILRSDDGWRNLAALGPLIEESGEHCL